MLHTFPKVSDTGYLQQLESSCTSDVQLLCVPGTVQLLCVPAFMWTKACFMKQIAAKVICVHIPAVDGRGRADLLQLQLLVIQRLGLL